ITTTAAPICSLRRFTSRINRARPAFVFTNPNRSLFSRSTPIRATEFLSPRSIPTKICLFIGANLLSVFGSVFPEPIQRLAFFSYIVNSWNRRGGPKGRGGSFLKSSEPNEAESYWIHLPPRRCAPPLLFQ